MTGALNSASDTGIGTPASPVIVPVSGVVGFAKSASPKKRSCGRGRQRVFAVARAEQHHVPIARFDHYLNWNIRVLLYVADRRGSHLDLVLIDCDEIGASAFNGLTLHGRVDSLKRVEVDGADGERRLRCSRLMYRFVDVDQALARRFYGFEAASHADDAG